MPFGQRWSRSFRCRSRIIHSAVTVLESPTGWFSMSLASLKGPPRCHEDGTTLTESCVGLAMIADRGDAVKCRRRTVLV